MFLRQIAPRPPTCATFAPDMGDLKHQPQASAPATAMLLAPVPEHLDEFPVWEAWGLRAIEEAGISGRVVADALLATHTEIGRLRACIVLCGDRTTEAEGLALAQALLASRDPMMQLWGKFQIANTKMNLSYTAQDEPEITGRGFAAVFEGMLEDLQKVRDERGFCLELQTRLYYAAGESYFLADNHQKAHRYAGELLVLASLPGFSRLLGRAKYLLASVEIATGSLRNAKVHIADILRLTQGKPGSYLHQVSSLVYADILHYFGDDNLATGMAGQSVLLPGFSSQNRFFAKSYSVKALRSRHEDVFSDIIDALANDSKHMVQYWALIIDLLSLPLSKVAQRKDFAKQAKVEIHNLGT
jgi:hypothetical protein